MNLKELRRQVQAKALDWRSVDKAVSSDEFEDAWEGATDEERKRLVALLDGGSRYHVRAWLSQMLSKELPHKSVRELRKLAKARGIPNYCLMNKEGLVRELDA